MRIVPTALSPAAVIDVTPFTDPRGQFARIFCATEFAAHGLQTGFVQSSLSYNPARHTLRGLHYQAAPYAEAKLVRCIRGAAWDVLLDLRPASPTHACWYAALLTADNRRSLYIPPGFAHGFLTLEDDTELLYQMTEPYRPEAAAGVRWNDPAFAVPWPCADPHLSERDAAYPDYLSAGNASPPAGNAPPQG